MGYKRLEAQHIIETIERLGNRIQDRFPGSGLRRVCAQLLEIGRQAQQRSNWISRPIIPLRLANWALILTFVAGAAWTVYRMGRPAEEVSLPDLIQTLEAGTNELLLVGAGVFFLISLERRIKRRRALAAIHELRSITHIIDMHQLTKDPERVLKRWSGSAHSPAATMSAFELQRYLDYCSEMLSLVGKIGAVYVEQFDDELAITAVNDVEELSGGLSRKIWQKIMILNSIDPEDLPNSTEPTTTPKSGHTAVATPPASVATTSTRSVAIGSAGSSFTEPSP